MFFGAFFLIWIVMIIVGFCMIIVHILYLITQTRLLELCHPYTRKMNPGEVWLVLIPLFGVVWHFIMIGRIADSLAIEFRNRNIPIEEDRPGYSSGITAQILMLCGMIPVLGLIAILVGAVLLFIYWGKMRDYKNRLEQHNMQMGGNPMAFQQASMQQYNQGNYPPQNRY